MNLLKLAQIDNLISLKLFQKYLKQNYIEKKKKSCKNYLVQNIKMKKITHEIETKVLDIKEEALKEKLFSLGA